MLSVFKKTTPSFRRFGLKWRSGHWYITFVVWLGIVVDLLAYSVVIPVLPFHLEGMGFKDVSSLTGYLLFSYSAGLALSTFPVAILSERYQARQWPIILGVIVLVGSMIMLMEAKVFWLMVIARVLQGIGSTLVWVAGLALLCDSAPVAVVGRQLGLAMTGLSVGFALGPPVGGVLYTHFGFRGPCIAVIAASAVELLAWILVIECKDAVRLGYDPQVRNKEEEAESQAVPTGQEVEATPEPQLSLLQVMVKLLTSSRAAAAALGVFVYGMIHSSIEPTLPSHMQEEWGYNSSQVGIVFVIAAGPSLVASAISGFLSDKIGPAPISTVSFLFCIPFWSLATTKSLGFFIACFTLDFFGVAAAVAPLSVELADVARTIPGIGYAHVYGVFNMAFGVGSVVGPILGGQVFDHVSNGWNVLCYIAVGLMASAALAVFFFVEEKPIPWKIAGWVAKRKAQGETPVVENRNTEASDGNTVESPAEVNSAEIEERPVSLKAGEARL